MSDEHWWAKAVLGAAVTALGWWNTMLHGRIAKIEEDRADTAIRNHQTFVSKDTFQATMQRIERLFERIEDKLDGKADRQ